MKLWTIQPENVWMHIQKEGYYCCSPTKSPFLSFEEFKLAYDWMIELMKSQGIYPENAYIKYPVWAWYRFKGKKSKPDLRSLMFRSCEYPTVCLELDVDEHRMLLTDEEKWHYVLNDLFYPGEDTNDDVIIDSIMQWYDKLNHSAQQFVRKSSWYSVLDTRNSEFVQATFWTLYRDDVRKVQTFGRRYR